MIFSFLNGKNFVSLFYIWTFAFCFFRCSIWTEKCTWNSLYAIHLADGTIDSALSVLCMFRIAVFSRQVESHCSAMSYVLQWISFPLTTTDFRCTSSGTSILLRTIVAGWLDRNAACISPWAWSYEKACITNGRVSFPKGNLIRTNTNWSVYTTDSGTVWAAAPTRMESL